MIFQDFDFSLVDDKCANSYIGTNIGIPIEYEEKLQ